MRTRVVICVALIACMACSEREPASDDRADVDTTSATIPRDSVITQPVILYVEATDSAIDAQRSEVSADDFAVIADDLMFYRATAIEYLDSLPRPYTRVNGRRPLTFRVAGRPRTYDLRDVELLDFIVVYETDREPRVIAPNEAQVVAEYFGTGG